MDGYEVLRRIKEDKETKEIPVILMMNVKDIQSELRGLEEGAIDFISLPFEPQVLKAGLRILSNFPYSENSRRI